MVYSKEKTFYKGLWVLGEVAIAGLVVYLTDNNYYIALVPVLEMLKNYIKHRKD